MKNINFYNSPSYRVKQSVLTKANWKKGIYDFQLKREKRQCARPGCEKIFETILSDSKKFCSRTCAAKVNNEKRGEFSPKQRKEIAKLYKKGLSMAEISERFGCTHGKIAYWMKKLNIPRRSQSEANYLKYNPNGDPFKIKGNFTKKEAKLKGLGLGLYWGEGDKLNRFATRVSNTDPELIKKFKEFLIKICGVKEEKFVYSLVIFNDGNEQKAINFWKKHLGIERKRLGKIVKIPPQGKGTYRKKNQTGVVTVGVYNIKLKAKILQMINEI